VVAGLQQERLVTEKELEALEAAEMAWLVRSKRPLSMPNSPSKERLSGIGGEREHAQAVGREQEERERRSGEALHQAKCLWVGRAVDNKERLRRERAKEIAKRAERRRLREEAERERIGCKRDTERMQGFELAVAAEAEVRARNARDRRWREQERERGQRLAQLKAKKAKDQRERERVKREECERLIEKEERRQRATGAQRPGAPGR